VRREERGEEGGAGEDGAEAGPDRAAGEARGFEASSGGGADGEVPVELSGEPGGLGVVEAASPADDAGDGDREVRRGTEARAGLSSSASRRLG